MFPNSDQIALAIVTACRLTGEDPYKVCGRADVSAAHLHALRKRKGWRTGRTGQFEKGAVSHNKGKRCAPGTGGNKHYGNSSACETKKRKYGTLDGNAIRKMLEARP